MALESGVGFDDGIWYPVVYAGIPALVAPLVYAHTRPDATPLQSVLLAGWMLVSSVLALEGTVVLVLGFPPTGPRPWLLTRLFPVRLYLGFLLGPVGTASVAARQRGLLAVVALLLSSVCQLLVAALLVLAR